MPTFYWFAYYQAQRDLRLDSRPMETQIHKVRDALISGSLFPTLCHLGYQYGCTILNLPENVSKELETRKCLRKAEAEPALGPDDLILLTTRPPLDDLVDKVSDLSEQVRRPAPHRDLPFRAKTKQDAPRRRIQRSGTDIEAAVFAPLRQIFSKCDRETIRLSDSVCLGTENRWGREVVFHQSQGGTVRHFVDNGTRVIPDPITSNDGKVLGNLTVGYFIYVTNLGKRYPARLVAAFGAGGTETMLFGTLLRDNQDLNAIFTATLQGSTSRFVMCTFLVPAEIPYPFLRYSAKDLDPKIIVNQEITILPA